MSLQRLFLLACLLLSGCLFEAREATDEAVREANVVFDGSGGAVTNGNA